MQVLSPQQWRNHNHPLLLLESARLVLRLKESRPTLQTAVEAGRLTSAGFGALTVVILSLAMFRVGGWAGCFCAAATLCLCNPLMVNAHYFKEDVALLLGIALTVFAAGLLTAQHTPERGSIGPEMPKRSDRAAALVGAACAIAASGKYIGIMILPFALAQVIDAHPSRRRSRAAAFLAAFLLVAVAINWRIAVNPVKFGDSLIYEIGHSVTKHHGITMNRPNRYFVTAAWQQTPWHIRLLAIGTLLLLVRTWKQRSSGDRLLVLFPFGFLLLISFAVLPMPRYVLPAVVFLHVAAVLGVSWTIKEVSGHPGWAGRCGRAGLLPAFVLLTVVVQGPACISMLTRIRHDSRMAVRAWVSTHVVPGEVICQDRYVGLHEPLPAGLPGSMEVITPQIHAADAGSLSELAGRGVRYIAVTSMAYSRFFRPGTFPAPGHEAQYQSRREWYTHLFSRYREVFRSGEPVTIGPVDPEIRVFDLTRPLPDRVPPT